MNFEYRDKSKVLVMNEQTWEEMKKQMLEIAPTTEDPIGYLGRFSGIDVEFDNELPFNVVEAYERWMWEAVKKHGRKTD